MTDKYNRAHLLTLLLLLLFAGDAFAQSELAPWGNIMGIRRQGQLLEFETSLTVTGKHGRASATGKELQRPGYTRVRNAQTVTTNIGNLYFKETVKDGMWGKAKVSIQLNCKADTVINGAYFCISLPDSSYSGKIQLTGSTADTLPATGPGNFTAKGFEIRSAHRRFSIRFDGEMPVVIKRDKVNGDSSTQLLVVLAQGDLHKGDSVQRNFTIKVSGDIDKSPAVIAVDTSKPGSAFAGLGGNFRLQNPKYDPQIINYCLNNMRVAWGRVEMPWRYWQPKEDSIPNDTARLHPAVKKAMEMAQRLHKMGIPLILSAWFPPAWAVTGKLNPEPVNGVWGNPLNPDKMQEIYKSITDYILFLKAHYDVEADLFSFNESDLGINIRLTGQQHDELIKGLGAYFATHGVKTKMLLGDNSDATTYKFIYPALNDAAARPYIGAVSFHSWRGWDTATLEKWRDAAKQLGRPLIVAEGSIDAQAWGYPQIFEEPTYALQEINLYTRLLNICQPLSILQWQLTADYSPLIGGGLFGNDEPMHPGQRFWNLKQMASTPANLSAMPVSCSNPVITCAALGNNSKSEYALHLVNNGAARQITLTGLPAGFEAANVYITNKNLHMQEKHPIKVKGGKMTLKLKADSYYTLMGSTLK